MDRLVDLHNHLLWGIDDGAKDPAEMAAMLKDASVNNVETIVATPHFWGHTDMLQYEKSFQEAADLGASYGIKILRGAEYNVQCFPLKEHRLLTLGEQPCGVVLIDFRTPIMPPEFVNCVDDIFNAGNALMLAHPERTFPMSMLEDLRKLAEMGVIYQVTAGSLLGFYGAEAKEFGWKLLKENLVRVIASDAHNSSSRASYLGKAYKVVARKLGREAAEVLADNARKVVEAPQKSLSPLPIRRFNWLGLGGWFVK